MLEYCTQPNIETKGLVVKEWKTRDELVISIESRDNQVLAIVTEELHNGKHGQTAMLDLGFTKPVQVDTNFIDGGKTKRVETNISSHGTVELYNDDEQKVRGRKSPTVTLRISLK